MYNPSNSLISDVHRVLVLLLCMSRTKSIASPQETPWRTTGRSLTWPPCWQERLCLPLPNLLLVTGETWLKNLSPSTSSSTTTTIHLQDVQRFIRFTGFEVCGVLIRLPSFLPQLSWGPSHRRSTTSRAALGCSTSCGCWHKDCSTGFTIGFHQGWSAISLGGSGILHRNHPWT